MSNHLRTKHQEKFKATIKDEAAEVSSQLVTDAIPGGSKSSTSTENPLNCSKVKKHHYLITEMIALDNQPLSVVENIGFSRLLQQVLPRYNMPDPTFISQKIVPDIYNRIYEKIKGNISNSLAISVTSNIWTCWHDSTSYLSFTAHWLSPEFQMKQGVLTIKAFSGSHTVENITKELNIIAARWDINQSKIHLLIYDSDACWVKSERAAEYYSARCFINSLQRIVFQSLKMQSEVVEITAVARSIAAHFSNSGLAGEKLLAIQKELGLPEHELVQDIDTRWNSTFYMIERLLEQKRAIFLYIVDDTLTNLTTQEWCLMEQCVKLLKPFEEIIRNISSGLSCISEVIPHVKALNKYLDKDKTAQGTPDLSHMRASLQAEIESHFSSLGENLNFLIATFLDPRFKADYLGALEVERVQQEILLEYMKMSEDESPNSRASSPSPTPAKRSRCDETGPTLTCEAYFNIWDSLNKATDESENQDQDEDHKYAIVSEMDHYLKAGRIDRTADPYIWWSVYSNQYPNLRKFARIYLSAPCSSVYNEHSFSEVGLVYENKRNRLLPPNGEKLGFIQHNLPLVNFEY